MIAYKLVRLRSNGTIGSLFINRKAVLPFNKWMNAKAHRTQGFLYRLGWHALHMKDAPHLSEKGRAWVKVRIQRVKKIQRSKSQGGFWYLAKRMKILEFV